MGVLIDTMGLEGITIQEEDGSPAVPITILKLPDRCMAVDHDSATTVHIRAAPR